jgi:hypothetical protein
MINPAIFNSFITVLKEGREDKVRELAKDLQLDLDENRVQRFCSGDRCEKDLLDLFDADSAIGRYLLVPSRLNHNLQSNCFSMA